MHTISEETFAYLAHKMVDYDWQIILGSSVGAGWLMGLVSWMVASAQETISRIFIVILITFLIGIGGLHHCIVGSIEVFAGLINSESITIGDYLHFQIWTTLGNLIGGVVFVAIVKYGHTSRSGR
jgi:formate/nitrite transporter FocA (FNT family)